MRKLIPSCALVALFLPFAAQLQAQDENLVPNGSFENGDAKKLKAYGQLEQFTTDWFAYTDAPLDWYSTEVKGEKVAVPANSYGYEDLFDGNRYGGFRAHTKSPKLARTYFQVRLSGNLEANQMYCVSFDISLSDLSKYAVNGIGAYFSDRKETQPNTGIVARDPQVKHRADKVMQLTEGWETVCGTVLGTGTEEYMTIGGFNGSRDIEEVKDQEAPLRDGRGSAVARLLLHRQRERGGDRRQEPVFLFQVVEHGAGPRVWWRSAAERHGRRDVVGRTAVYYAFVKRAFTEDGKASLDRLAAVLKAHPEWSVEIMGHCDNDEVSEGKINPRFADMGRKRAEQVKRYLVPKAGSDGQLSVIGAENADPASTKDSDLARAKNRRVTFRIK